MDANMPYQEAEKLIKDNPDIYEKKIKQLYSSEDD
jgi:uncharacterized protein YneF (UPF0154 family)